MLSRSGSHYLHSIFHPDKRQRNGGIITTDHTTADYAILYSRSKTFKDLLQSALAANRPTVSASFVHDCVQHNTIIDPTPYLFEKPRPKTKRKRTQSFSNERWEDRKGGKGQERTAGRRRKDDNGSKSPKKPKLVKSDTDDRPRLRSPTPPPAHTRVEWPGRGFKFSEHERQYAMRYLEILLERDHQMSSNAMALALFSKVSPHERCG